MGEVQKDEKGFFGTIWSGVKSTTESTLIGIGAFTLATVTITTAVSIIRKRRNDLPRRFFISLDISGPFTETQPKSGNLLRQLALPNQPKKKNFLELLKVIERAEHDPRVVGLIGHCSGGQVMLSPAQTQELSEAILRFKNGNNNNSNNKDNEKKDKNNPSSSTPLPPKKTFFFAETLEGNAGLQGYQIMSSFSRISFQPGGILWLTGATIAAPFLRKMLDKIGIEPIVRKREGYKSALDFVAREGRSKEDAEQVAAILDGWINQVSSFVAANRPALSSSSSTADVESVKKLITSGPFVPEEAKANGLIDTVEYRDEFLKTAGIRDKIDEEARRKQLGSAATEKPTNSVVASKDPTVLAVDVFRYGKKSAKLDSEEDDAAGKLAFQLEDLEDLVLKQKIQKFFSKMKHTIANLSKKYRERGGRPIAVLSLSGPISRGGAAGAEGIRSVPVCKELKKLRLNPKVKAVILRIDSPGGCAVASESIFREAKLLKESGKILIVSMSSVAASGGYYIAAASPHIFALPTTITGSIGVILGKLNFQPFLEKIGVKTDKIQRGDNSDAFSPFQGFSETNEGAVNKLMDSIYESFLARVAEGRGVEVEKIRKLAGGRVYTGEDAKKVGLVDECGGLYDAIEFAKRAAGLPHSAAVDYLPRPLSTLQIIRDKIEGSDDSPESQVEVNPIFSEIVENVSETVEEIVVGYNAKNGSMMQMKMGNDDLAQFSGKSGSKW